MLIDDYYEHLKKNGLNKVVMASEAMIIPNSMNEDGWVEWQPIESNIKLEDIKNIESAFNIKIPKEYSNFILAKQFMDIQIDNYTLYGINDVNTLKKRIELLPPEVVSKGFLPIGITNSEDYIVLDHKTGNILQMSLEDYSIVKKLFDSFNEFVKYLSLQLTKLRNNN